MITRGKVFNGSMFSEFEVSGSHYFIEAMITSILSFIVSDNSGS